MSFQWQVTPDAAWGGLADTYVQAIRAAVRAIALRRAPEIEAWMKANANWTDRTGNARQTLEAVVEDAALDMTEIILQHGVEYGLFLELAHGGAYAIVGPALDYWGPIIWQDIAALFA